MKSAESRAKKNLSFIIKTLWTLASTLYKKARIFLIISQGLKRTQTLTMPKSQWQYQKCRQRPCHRYIKSFEREKWTLTMMLTLKLTLKLSLALTLILKVTLYA
jgi:hypothetical protein